MTNYREILRLTSLGINNKQIAESMGIARQTVITTLQRAIAQGLDWQNAESLSSFLPGWRLRPCTVSRGAAAFNQGVANHKTSATPSVVFLYSFAQWLHLANSPQAVLRGRADGRARQAAPLHITLRCGRKPDELSSHFDIAPADTGKSDLVHCFAFPRVFFSMAFFLDLRHRLIQSQRRQPLFFEATRSLGRCFASGGCGYEIMQFIADGKLPLVKTRGWFGLEWVLVLQCIRAACIRFLACL